MTANPLVLSPTACRGLRWQIPQDLAFAARHHLMPLHVGELAHAAASMPLALVQHQQQWRLVGVCGNTPNHNLFIKEGVWLGHHRPDWLNTYPFEIMALGEKSIATFDRASDLLTDDVSGEPFFDEHDQMFDAVAHRVEALKASHGKHQSTRRMLEALSRAGVVTPWPDTLKRQAGITMDGLYMIDERALAALDDETYLTLRKAGALPVAYAVNLSLAQTHLLARLAHVNPPAASAERPVGGFFDGEEELVFDFDN
ncbi:SapC family protein [Kushneria sp. Sum13]|uniref:SapC family protein n=1 Tax=Kushneria sp. Sum13 TaxID=3459196 RepID=UPI00404685C9